MSVKPLKRQHLNLQHFLQMGKNKKSLYLIVHKEN